MSFRYDRQMRVEGWQQEKFFEAELVLVGAGALGTMLGTQFTCLGIGYLKIYDFDKVDSTNLNRQFHYYDAVGEYKSEALAKKLKLINPEIKIEAYKNKIDDDTVGLLGKPTVIVEGVDNLQARAVINKYVVENKIPLVSGATSALGGQVITYKPRESRCLDCYLNLYENAKERNQSRSCNLEPDPSIITTNWIISGILADEVRKIIAPINEYDTILKEMLVYSSKERGRFAFIKPSNKKCQCYDKD